MGKIIENYVEYLYVGLMGSYTESREVDSIDPRHVTVPEGGIGFRFSTETTKTISGVAQPASKVVNKTPWFFIGKRLTVDDISLNYGDKPETARIVKHMKKNGITYACVTEYGNFMAMGEDDTTLDEYISRYEASKKEIM